MVFTPKVWANDPAGGTPVTAAELNRVEQGISDVHGLNAALTNATLITETVIAQFTLPANYFAANTSAQLRWMGQVSSTATLIYRIRVGTVGTTTDALAITFATSAAGAANAHTQVSALITCLTAGSAGTLTAGGNAQLVGATLGPVTGAFAAAAVNTTVSLKVSLTAQMSATQTLTSRAAVLTRLS